jgi:hypothetical protein
LSRLLIAISAVVITSWININKNFSSELNWYYSELLKLINIVSESK